MEALAKTVPLFVPPAQGPKVLTALTVSSMPILTQEPVRVTMATTQIMALVLSAVICATDALTAEVQIVKLAHLTLFKSCLLPRPIPSIVFLLATPPPTSLAPLAWVIEF